MATPWKTTDQLVADIKRKIAIPISQITFTESDVIAFLNDEMKVSQIPSVLEYHAEYYVVTEDEALVDNKTKYAIPDRAIGMKLRNLFWKDTSGNLYNMSMVSQEDKAYFQSDFSTNQFIATYYMENNNVVLTPSNTANATGSLTFDYFLRPNELVSDDRAATCTGFSKTITVSNDNLDVGDTITIGSTTWTVVSGSASANQFQKAATSALTAANLNTAINNDSDYTSSVNNAIVTVVYTDSSTEFTTTDEDGLVIQETIGIVCSSVPANIVTGLVDLLQTAGGHKTLAWDVSATVSGSTIIISEDDLPDDFIVGDYVCNQYECIIPYLPTDMHTGLAERAANRILAAQGDYAGVQESDKKLSEIDKRQATLMQNRVDGSPAKITNRNSLLQFGKWINRRYY